MSERGERVAEATTRPDAAATARGRLQLVVSEYGFLAAAAVAVAGFAVLEPAFLKRAYFVQSLTRFGFTVFAVGENPEAARLCGLPTLRTRPVAYVISGLGAGLAGIVLASQVHTASAVYGGGYELDVIAAIVVGGTSLFGGRGSVHRSILGALTIGVINNGLSILNIDLSRQLIIKGLIIVLALSLDAFLRRDRA